MLKSFARYFNYLVNGNNTNGSNRYSGQQTHTSSLTRRALDRAKNLNLLTDSFVNRGRV